MMKRQGMIKRYQEHIMSIVMVKPCCLLTVLSALNSEQYELFDPHEDPCYRNSLLLLDRTLMEVCRNFSLLVCCQCIIMCYTGRESE